MAAATTNFDACTQDLWRPGVVPEIIMKNPLLAWLKVGGRVTIKGGKVFKRTVQKAGMSNLLQVYSGGRTPLTNEDKTLWTTAAWNAGSAQLPIQWDQDEEFANAGKAQIIPIAIGKLKIAQRSIDEGLREKFYAASSTSTSPDSAILAADNARLYSLQDGCSLTGRTANSLAYGGLTSTTTSNVWWNGCSLTGAFNDSGTAATASFGELNKALDAAMTYAPTARYSEFMFLCSPTIMRALELEAESKGIIQLRTESQMAKLGFNAIGYKGVEIVSDPYLERNAMDATSSPGAVNSTRQKQAYLLWRPSWEFIVDPARAFKLTTPKWQGEVANGGDYWLQRIMIRTPGPICIQPNANRFYSDMT